MVGMELRQQLKLSQQLVMTPQLQQAIKLLQLSRIELVDMVRQELEENPVLEEKPRDPRRRPPGRPRRISRSPRSNVTSEPSEQEAVDGSKEIDWEKYLENHANQLPTPSGSAKGSADDMPPIEATVGSVGQLGGAPALAAAHGPWSRRRRSASSTS